VIFDPTGKGVYDTIAGLLRIPSREALWPIWAATNPLKLLRYWTMIGKRHIPTPMIAAAPPAVDAAEGKGEAKTAVGAPARSSSGSVVPAVSLSGGVPDSSTLSAGSNGGSAASALGTRSGSTYRAADQRTRQFLCDVARHVFVTMPEAPLSSPQWYVRNAVCGGPDGAAECERYRTAFCMDLGDDAWGPRFAVAAQHLETSLQRVISPMARPQPAASMAGAPPLAPAPSDATAISMLPISRAVSEVDSKLIPPPSAVSRESSASVRWEAGQSVDVLDGSTWREARIVQLSADRNRLLIRMCAIQLAAPLT
jgi:hypothetical protein